MRVPSFLFRARKKRGAEASAVGPGEIRADADAADQDGTAAPPPLPRRRPGSHVGEEFKVVKVDPAAADPVILRKVLDRLNGL
jgi:hypothetical protein